MQTAVDYIFEQLEEQGLIFLTTKTNEMTISISTSDYLDIKRLAKEMEKQQIIDAHISGYDSSGGSADDYYTFYYGSKGSDNSPKVQNKDSFGGTSSQTEISDEEIDEQAEVIEFGINRMFFKTGAKWYRKQLKSRK